MLLAGAGANYLLPRGGALTFDTDRSPLRAYWNLGSAPAAGASAGDLLPFGDALTFYVSDPPSGTIWGLRFRFIYTHISIAYYMSRK